MIFRRTMNVPVYRDFRRYRNLLRNDFQHRCAYCLCHELLFLDGAGGAIDHFRPLNPPDHVDEDFTLLANAYGNLYWTCGRCNLNKGNTWPTRQQYLNGERFVDPCADDHSDHWDLENTGALMAKTITGQYTITFIRLNRAMLIQLRRRFLERQEKIAHIRARITASAMSLAHKNEILKYLDDDFLINPPAFER